MRLVALTLLLVGCAHSEPPPSPPARPAAEAVPGFKNVPPHMFEVWAVEQPVPRLTDATKQHYAGKTPLLVGLYTLCVATNGSVVNVKTISSVPESNDSIVATLEQWKFRPQPIPVCSLVKLEFEVAPPPPPKPAPPTSTSPAPSPVLR